jgi:hypothetical protein
LSFQIAVLMSRRAPVEILSVKRKTVKARTGSAVTLSPVFTLIFLTVVTFTALSMLISVVLAMRAPSDPANQVLAACLDTWKLGVGAIVGLLAGKAV